MNIAAFVLDGHPSSGYRAVHPIAELARRGNFVARYEIDGPPAGDAEIAAIVDQFEVAFFGRCECQPDAVQAAQRLAAAGMPLVWDCDNALVEPERRADFDAMVGCVDVVTTTTDLLAERYRELGAPSVVSIPNYLTRSSLRFPRRRHEGVVLGYTGWRDHQDDWDRLGLRDVVEDLLDVYDDLRIESAGPVDLGLPEDRCHSYGALGFDQLPQAIAGFDLAVAPLAAGPASEARSDIKLKEYAIVGVPWLASDYGPYAGYGEEQGGRLVADDDWFDALNGLLRDGKAQRKLAKRGHKWAKELTLERHASLWLDALQQAVAAAEERRGAPA